MNAKQELLEVYENWRKWSEREGDAILAGDWPAVGECQEAKRGLQPQIHHLTGQAQAEWGRQGFDWAEVQRDVRRVVGVLMGLETRNSEILADKRRTAEVTMAGLDGTHRKLRRIQLSYATPQPAAWHTYS